MLLAHDRRATLMTEEALASARFLLFLFSNILEAPGIVDYIIVLLQMHHEIRIDQNFSVCSSLASGNFESD